MKYLNLDFRKGFVYLDNIQVYFVPLNYFFELLRGLTYNIDDDKLFYIYKRATLEDSIIIINSNLSKSGSFMKLKYFIDFINNFGLGKIEIKVFRTDFGVFIIRDCHLKKIYDNIYKNSKLFFPEMMLFSMLSNAIEIIFKKKVKTEINYLGEKNGYVIRIQFEEDIIYKLKKKKNILYYKEKGYNMSRLMTNLILKRKITIENSHIRVMDISAVLIPYYFLINMFNTQMDSLEELGFSQAKASVDMHMHIFGIKDKKDAFKNVLEMSEISGLGRVSLNKDNPFDFNFYCNTNKYLNENNFDGVNYLREHFLSICKGVVDYSYDVRTKNISLDNTRVILNKIEDERLLSNKEKDISKILNLRLLSLKCKKK